MEPQSDADPAPLNIAVLAGTTRNRRRSIAAARYVAEFGRQLPGVEITFVDPVDFDFPGDGKDDDAKDPRFTAIVRRADAFFVVTPEYNHSFPGSLKRMLDSEFELYNHKPVAFAGVSDGNWGGVRAVESLIPAVRETGLMVLAWDVYFPYVQRIFDADGRMLDEYRERYDRNLGRLYHELIWMARLLRRGRAQLEAGEP